MPMRIVEALTVAFNAIGSGWIFFLMCLICADVFGRYALSSPIPGVTEIVELSIVGIVFLQLAHATWSGRITRADTLLRAVGRRAPRAAALVDLVANLAGAALLLLIVVGTWPRLVGDYVNDYHVGTPGLFTFPSWPVKFVIVAGGALTAVQFLLKAAGAGRMALRRPDTEQSVAE